MATKSTIQLPDLPDDWYQNATGVPASGVPSGAAPGILAGLPAPREWGLADSGLNIVMSPDEIKTIDFSGTAPQEPPPWLSQTDHGAAAKPGPSAPRLFHPGQNEQPGQDWVQLPRPQEMESGEHGSGYYVYGTDDTGRPGTTARSQWGRPKSMEVIGSVADQLATGGTYTPFGVGNMSLPAGGPFKEHKGHYDGLDIDVRPARIDGAELPVTYRDRNYDRAATQRLIDAFRATGQVDKIYFNDPAVDGVQPLPKHDNHFHVRLRR